MTTAARLYADQYDAVWEQWQRLFGPQPDDVWAGPAAAQFRFDPRRELDANLAALASCVEPGDVLVDVGGGAGRVSLPLGLRCQEVVTVEPSPAMAAEYAGLVQEAGITNARLLAGDWMEADGVAGDVVVTCDVTYFVRDIVPFVRRMEAAARRRVMITVWSEPPPNRGADLFRRVYGEPQVPMCGHRQLLPVLWEMGVLPEVRVLPDPSLWETWHFPTRDEAVESVLFGRWSREADRERARKIFEEQFDEIFSPDGEGYRAKWRAPMRELLITWETKQRETKQG